MSDSPVWTRGAPQLDDPYPAYAAQRAAAALQHVGDGVALATSERAVRRLLTEARCGCARVPPAAELGGGDARLGEPLRRTLASMATLRDGADHARVRRPLLRAFAPAAVAPFRAPIRALCVEHVARAAAAAAGADGAVDVGFGADSAPYSTSVEIVSALADPLVGAVLDELLGLPAGTGARLRATWRYASASVDDPDRGLPPDAPLALLELHEQVAIALKQARLNRAGGLPIHRYVRAAAQDQQLTELQLIANLIFVLGPGHRSGSQALALAIHALACHPEQYARLRDDPQLVAGAVEELLRWDGAVQSTTRVVREDVAHDGGALHANDLALLILGAANRDPAAFADADRLDVGAGARRHLSFGYGVHFCVGAPLMRIVLQEAIAALVARAPTLALAVPPVWSAPRRGFERLEVRW